jgi:hypothetical protein
VVTEVDIVWNLELEVADCGEVTEISAWGEKAVMLPMELRRGASRAMAAGGLYI